MEAKEKQLEFKVPCGVWYMEVIDVARSCCLVLCGLWVVVHVSVVGLDLEARMCLPSKRPRDVRPLLPSAPAEEGKGRSYPLSRPIIS